MTELNHEHSSYDRPTEKLDRNLLPNILRPSQAIKISGGRSGAVSAIAREGVLSAITDFGAGIKYQINEDGFAVVQSEKSLYIFSSDGAGGHGAGHRASHSFLLGGVKAAKSEEGITKIFETGSRFIMAHYRALVRENSKESKLAQDMAACAVGVQIRGKKAIFANTGDSKAILIRKGTILHITPEHNRAFERLSSKFKKGQVSEKDMMEAEDRNIITKCLGIVSGKYLDDPKPSTSSMRLQAEDRIVLASDGLWDLLTTGDVAQIVSSAESTQDAVSQLRELVRELVVETPNNDDNINIIVYEQA